MTAATGGEGRQQGAQERRPAVPRRFWWRPALYGEPAAVDMISTIAAPVLAGFSIALLGVVAQAPANFRWPGVALLLLLLTAILFVMCLQCGFWARQYLVSRGEAAAWFDDFDSTTRQEQVRREQVAYGHVYEGWARRSKLFYRMALQTMFAALLVVLLPTAGGDGAMQSGWRWAAASLAALAFVFEALWIVSVQLVRVRALRRAPWVEVALSRLLLPGADHHR
ncbi:hypothetical protein ACLQ29_20190 [Micromonospora sp. DT228]|uniref:hypothetical protein n=1 Tax=Micromonospora sp. DT228 TaxID=3393443 RepID=UPI003CE9ACF4